MANFTEQAIKNSFIKLLNEKPLSKISVRDIVEDCGINRNSFYYHFQDIPALIEEIITQLFNSLLEKHPTVSSLGDLFEEVSAYTLNNKKALLHIYNSVSRDLFEKYLLKFCDYAVTAYVDTAFRDKTVAEADRTVIIRFVKCEVFGAYLEWLDRGLSEDSVQEIHRMLTLCHGMSEEIICRSQKTTL